MVPGVSRGQIEWLTWMQTQKICVDKNGIRQTIQHGLNYGEYSVNGKPVDGFMRKDGELFFFEFYGCFFHPGCCVDDSKIYNAAEKRYKDQVKRTELRNLGTLITIYACDWEEKKRRMRFPATDIPRILINDTESSLLAAIQREEIFGFAVADVETPDSVRESFGSFLFPPVIRRTELNSSHLSDFMQKVCEEDGRKMQFNTLVQTYNCKQELLMTPLIKMYLDRGLKVKNISRFIQYQAGRGLRPFVRKVVKMRTEAKKSGDEAKSLTAKLFGNSSYGKCGESILKYRDTTIALTDEAYDAKIRSPLFQSSVEVSNESDFVCHEITSLPKSSTDNKPVHVSVAILQHAKILFLKFMWFLFDHLQPGSFRTCYADTDR